MPRRNWINQVTLLLFHFCLLLWHLHWLLLINKRFTSLAIVSRCKQNSYLGCNLFVIDTLMWNLWRTLLAGDEQPYRPHSLWRLVFFVSAVRAFLNMIFHGAGMVVHLLLLNFSICFHIHEWCIHYRGVWKPKWTGPGPKACSMFSAACEDHRPQWTRICAFSPVGIFWIQVPPMS